MTRTRRKANTRTKVTKGITTLALTGVLTASIGVSALAAPTGNMPGNAGGFESQTVEQKGDFGANQSGAPTSEGMNGAANMQMPGDQGMSKNGQPAPGGENDQGMPKSGQQAPGGENDQGIPKGGLQMPGGQDDKGEPQEQAADGQHNTESRQEEQRASALQDNKGMPQRQQIPGEQAGKGMPHSDQQIQTEQGNDTQGAQQTAGSGKQQMKNKNGSERADLGQQAQKQSNMSGNGQSCGRKRADAAGQSCGREWADAIGKSGR